MKKEVFSTKPLNWNVGADWEFVWKSSIMNYCEAFLQLGIPRFPKVWLRPKIFLIYLLTTTI